MKVLDGLDTVDPPLDQSILTIGNFDGVHRAHQQLLAQAGLFAANTGGPVVVLTFEPHPLSVVSPERAPQRLSLPEEKLRALASAGADLVVVARSEPALLELDAERFIEEVIVRRFHPTHIVEGPSFGFGKNRRGTPKLLRDLARRFEYEVHIVEPVNVQIDEGDTRMVSSSLIRKLLTEGKVRRAALCLGRRYALIGPVERGAGRGRTLGFPTANLGITAQLIPGEGVYAGAAILDDRTHACAISIGRTPTFGESERRVEAHLLNFDEDIYGATLRIEFNRRLRKQKTFDTPEALVRQLHLDIDAVRRLEIDAESSPPARKTQVS